VGDAVWGVRAISGDIESEPPRKLTPQEMNEAQRQADEALSKYLAAANPEPRYRPETYGRAVRHVRVRWRW
jgi:hypothetical protein